MPARYHWFKTRSYPAQKESVDPLEILTEFLIRFYKAMVILPEF